MASHTLLAAARDGAEALEAAWLESLEDPPPTEAFLMALDALPAAEGRRMASTLLALLLESCEQREAFADVLVILRRLALLGPAADLAAKARRALEALHGHEPWLATVLGLARLDDGALAEGFQRYDRLLAMFPGCAVNHPAGWGEGVVTALDPAEEGIVVRFTSDDRERAMPFTTALEVLKVLPPDDLRARMLTDVEGLRADADDRPELLVRGVARLHKGRCTAKQIKDRLFGSVIPSSAWAGWWRKAKVAASSDPFLSVDNPSRPVFTLRERALDPEAEVRAALGRAHDLAATLEVARGPLSLQPAPALRELMLDAVAQHAHAGDPFARAEAAVLLGRYGRLEVAQAGRTLQALAQEAGSVARLLSRLKPAALRREALDAFIAAEPTLWSDALIGELTELPPQLLDIVVDRLVAEGRGPAAANRFAILLLNPSRQPAAVLRLAGRFAGGLFEGLEQAPVLTDVVMGLLHLAETQAPRAARGDRPARDAVTGVSDLLIGRDALAQRFVADANRADLERALSVMARCRSMPDTLSRGLDALVHARFPDLVARAETPFWHAPVIYSSRAGLARRHEEYRVLIEETIPANSDTIGKAASYGDLSENFEWTSAIEQQRQLTEKAAVMEAELRQARALEDETVPSGIVAPGTRVSYEEAGTLKTITILGPWDGAADVVSYRAPVAAGMLGARVGETATLELPSGAIEVVIRTVEKAL